MNSGIKTFDEEIPVQVDPVTGEIFHEQEPSLTLPRQRDSGIGALPDIVECDEITFIDVPEGPIAAVDGGVEAVLPFLVQQSMHKAVLDAKDPRRGVFQGRYHGRSGGNFRKRDLQRSSKIRFFERRIETSGDNEGQARPCDEGSRYSRGA